MPHADPCYMHHPISSLWFQILPSKGCSELPLPQSQVSHEFIREASGEP